MKYFNMCTPENLHVVLELAQNQSFWKSKAKLKSDIIESQNQSNSDSEGPQEAPSPIHCSNQGQ